MKSAPHRMTFDEKINEKANSPLVENSQNDLKTNRCEGRELIRKAMYKYG